MDLQEKRESFFLQKYLHLLNTIFKSNLGDIQSYDSFYELLKLRQLGLELDNKYQGISVYLYEYVNWKLSTVFKQFTSINELSKYLGVARETLYI